MRRVGYILLRIATDLVSLLSRAINAFVFGGSTAQTLSARCHLEAPHSAVWARRRGFINAIFFLQPDHCRWAWVQEVDRARHVLQILRANGG